MEGNPSAAPSGPRVYMLKAPVSVAGQEVVSLTVRRPKGRSFRRMKMRQYPDGSMEMDLGSMMEVLADCTGCSSLVIDELDAGDLFELVEVLTDFLPDGVRATSRK